MSSRTEEQLETRDPGQRPVRAYGTGRACTYPGCTTQLSVYNANDRCWTHVRARTPESPDQAR